MSFLGLVYIIFGFKINLQTNPHLSEDNLIDKANEQIHVGNTQEAILYYEAAVQRNPRDAAAWCQLGLSHAENEHDIAAISAFRKSLEIEPDMRDALLGYSVSLANESYDNESLTQLEHWINTYKNGAWKSHTLSDQPTDFLHQSYIDPIRFEKVERQFLDAARAQTNIDPELQNALGVLYNLNRNFDRAIDSIKAAIAQNPDVSLKLINYFVFLEPSIVE
jgi:peroxin-5